MTITLNGDKKNIDGVSTLSELLKELNLSPETVVVELNTKIIPPDTLAATPLVAGDTVEIIRFVGGG
ncbi:MAG: sulfur carrier protein ThiS [Thermodesulfobacteriota bacterium]